MIYLFIYLCIIIIIIFSSKLVIQDIKEKKDEDLLVLPTDAALFDDPSFKVTEILGLHID